MQPDQKPSSHHESPADTRDTLRLLLVEDSEDDARVIVRELRRGGYEVDPRRVETPETLEGALDDGPWDLVISDHNLPGFSAPEALRLVQKRVPSPPFIIVSGVMGEALAVDAMKAGASDYLVKGQLSRLVPAVRRELADAEEHRQRVEAQAALERTERQLRQAQKMEAIGRLAGGIAHDFNNLLTAILGYSELLLQQMAAETPQRADLDEIRKAGERAAALTRQLLAFSRQQILEPRVAEFNDIVTNVEKLLRRVIGADVDLITDLDPAAGRVKVDPGQMEQLLMNLAVNARDAMPDGGRLVLRTRRTELARPHHAPVVTIEPGAYLLATVSDTGAGMTPEVLKQIFEPFFTTKAAGEGTGLGLSTVYGIVQQSDGAILVDSEPGRGTTFEIYLPSVDAPRDAEAPAAGAVVRATGSESILLVDDDAGVCALLHRSLTDAGYHVVSASDGLDALEAVRDASRRGH